MPESHEQAAERAEREADDLDRRTQDLGDRIDEVRQDWERKKRDPDVPGAGERPEAERDEIPPEADFPAGR